MAQTSISLILGWYPRIFSVDSISLSASPNTSQLLLLLSHCAHDRRAAHKLHTVVCRLPSPLPLSAPCQPPGRSRGYRSWSWGPTPTSRPYTSTREYEGVSSIHTMHVHLHQAHPSSIYIPAVSTSGSSQQYLHQAHPQQYLHQAHPQQYLHQAHPSSIYIRLIPAVSTKWSNASTATVPMAVEKPANCKFPEHTFGKKAVSCALLWMIAYFAGSLCTTHRKFDYLARPLYFNLLWTW